MDGSPKEGENSFKYMDGDKLKSTKWTDHPNRLKKKKNPASKKVNSRRIWTDAKTKWTDTFHGG